MRTALSGEEDEYLVEQVALCKIKQASLRSSGACEINVNCRLQALGLYIFARDCRRDYKRRGLYPRGIISRIEKAIQNKLQ